MTNKRPYYLLKLKNKYCQNIKKKLPHSFYILRVKCASILVFIDIFMPQFFFDETIFYNILCTLVTKNVVSMNFNFSHTIYPLLCIVPLYDNRARHPWTENSLKVTKVKY